MNAKHETKSNPTLNLCNISTTLSCDSEWTANGEKEDTKHQLLIEITMNRVRQGLNDFVVLCKKSRIALQHRPELAHDVLV